jgi:hypothetical protein
MRDHASLEPQQAYCVNCVINKQPIDLTSLDLRSDDVKVAEIVNWW